MSFAIYADLGLLGLATLKFVSFGYNYMATFNLNLLGV